MVKETLSPFLTMFSKAFLPQGCLESALLTLYHTIPMFNDPDKEAIEKHYGKRRKCWQPA